MTRSPFPAAPGQVPRVEALPGQWAALHEAAALVARLAGAAAHDHAAALLTQPCPEPIRRAAGWRLGLIAQGLADMAAILEGGIRALLVAQARGGPVGPAAEALWDEFLSARAALLELAGRS